MRIYYDGDGGLFGVALGEKSKEPAKCDLDAIATMHDAEEAFERIIEQTARTEFDDDLHVRLALSALIGAWQCVTRARASAGY